jgi:type I restriction enzyme M protein
LKLELEDEESECYVSEPEERYQTLNDKDEYISHDIFYVPQKARWGYLQSKAKSPEIGKLVDDAMDEIEKVNPGLKGNVVDTSAMFFNKLFALYKHSTTSAGAIIHPSL